MTNKELDEFIKHYIEKDKTNSAILLTAPWGAGKSFYIQNELIPFLSKEENGGYKCIVVSLFGLNDLNEVSKALYMESRLKLFANDSEKTATGKFIAKTIIKGVTSFLGVDLSKTDEEMQILYESVDLSGKLIIIEDLERSGIDIVEILGFVNNLVEQDKVKVLLVANEDELINYESDNVDTQENPNTNNYYGSIHNRDVREYTVSSKRYLTVKEKTVSDTILFEANYSCAVQEIMQVFNRTFFSVFCEESAVEEIVLFLKSHSISNLRTFIFACQKSNDIFERITLDPETDWDFIKTIFYGIIVLSHKIRNGDNVDWEEGSVFSTILSSEKYPLFRFCYDYIMSQTLDLEKSDNAKEALKLLRLYDRYKSAGDKDLNTIYNWFEKTEENVLDAVQSITVRLENDTDISFYEYGRLLSYLIILKYQIGCSIEKAVERIIWNFHNNSDNLDPDYVFITQFEDDDSRKMSDEYADVKRKIKESVMRKKDPIYGFDYNNEGIVDFCKEIASKQGQIISNGGFFVKINPEKSAEMLKHCSAEQISILRFTFRDVCSRTFPSNCYAEEKSAIKKLIDQIKRIEEFEGFDKIQKIQIHYLINDLAKYHSYF